MTQISNDGCTKQPNKTKLNRFFKDLKVIMMALVMFIISQRLLRTLLIGFTFFRAKQFTDIFEKMLNLGYFSS